MTPLVQDLDFVVCSSSPHSRRCCGCCGAATFSVSALAPSSIELDDHSTLIIDKPHRQIKIGLPVKESSTGIAATGDTRI